MSEAVEKVQENVEEAQPQETKSLLEQAIDATTQTEPDRTKELLSALTDEALKGTVTWDKNLTKTVQLAIEAIDLQVSKQLAEIMHDQKYLGLEGTWRGMAYLVKNSLCGSDLKIRVFNANKKELNKDFNKALDFDQSVLFKKLYENEFGTPGGEPYSVLLGDYQFGNNPEDLNLLDNIAHVSAAAFCPFVSAAHHSLLGLQSWRDLSKPRDLEKIFESAEYLKWRGIRESEDSRFVNMVMPRVLSRLPYGKDTLPIEEFSYEEGEFDNNHKAKELQHDQYCWMNAAYVMGSRLTSAFAEYGWCTAIRGAENGGKVSDLPTHVFTSDSGDLDLKCPTEIGITDRREAELSKLGFLPLCHYKNTNYAVFFGGQSIQKPLLYDTAEATANAAISARLPYIMATSRFAHYLKVLARDKIGSFMEAADVENWLNRWIINYVNANPDCGARLRASYPLAEARVEVKEIPGRPGSYNAVAWLRPWLQLEELTTSLRLVARIPEAS